jgi:hypothetical protein
MEQDGSLQYWQEHVTGSYPKPVESSLHPSILFL